VESISRESGLVRVVCVVFTHSQRQTVYYILKRGHEHTRTHATDPRVALGA